MCPDPRSARSASEARRPGSFHPVSVELSASVPDPASRHKFATTIRSPGTDFVDGCRSQGGPIRLSGRQPGRRPGPAVLFRSALRHHLAVRTLARRLGRAFSHRPRWGRRENPMAEARLPPPHTTQPVSRAKRASSRVMRRASSLSRAFERKTGARPFKGLHRLYTADGAL